MPKSKTYEKLSYKFILEGEEDFDDFTYQSSSYFRDIACKKYCQYLFHERDGWEWMKDIDYKPMFKVYDPYEKCFYACTVEIGNEPVFYVRDKKVENG
jgi:hypothetical protein